MNKMEERRGTRRAFPILRSPQKKKPTLQGLGRASPSSDRWPGSHLVNLSLLFSSVRENTRHAGRFHGRNVPVTEGVRADSGVRAEMRESTAGRYGAPNSQRGFLSDGSRPAGLPRRLLPLCYSPTGSRHRTTALTLWPCLDPRVSSAERLTFLSIASAQRLGPETRLCGSLSQGYGGCSCASLACPLVLLEQPGLGSCRRAGRRSEQVAERGGDAR